MTQTMTPAQRTSATPATNPIPPIPPLRQRPAFIALQKHYETIKTRHLRELFKADPARGERMAFDAVGLHFDYSKHRVTDETLKLLLQLAAESNLRARIDGMIRRKVYASSEVRIVEGPTASDEVAGTSRGLFLTIKPEHFKPMRDFVDGVPTVPNFGNSTL